MINQIPEYQMTFTELRMLDDFLMAINADMNVYSAHGFFTAIISSHPKGIRLVDWLKILFDLGNEEKWEKAKRPLFLNEEESQIVLLILERLQLIIAEELKQPVFYPLVSITQPKLNLLEANPDNIKEWCYGYVQAVQARIPMWSAAEEVLKSIFPITLLSGTLSFEDLSKEDKKAINMEEERKKCIETLPKIVLAVYKYWYSYSDTLKHKSLDKLKKLKQTGLKSDE